MKNMPVFATYNAATDGDLSAVIGFGGMTSQNEIELQQVILNLSTASTLTNSFTVDRRSHRTVGAAGLEHKQYANLLTQDMTTVKNVVWKPEDGPILMNGKDRIGLSWTADKAWDIEVYYRSA